MSNVVYCLASFFLAVPSSLALQGALQDVFCKGVSSDVAKPGERASFHCCQQGFLLSSKGVHLLSHMFICLVFRIQNVEESSEAFRFKYLYASLCFCCRVQLSHPSIEED